MMTSAYHDRIAELHKASVVISNENLSQAIASDSAAHLRQAADQAAWLDRVQLWLTASAAASNPR